MNVLTHHAGILLSHPEVGYLYPPLPHIALVTIELDNVQDTDAILYALITSTNVLYQSIVSVSRRFRSQNLWSHFVSIQFCLYRSVLSLRRCC